MVDSLETVDHSLIGVRKGLLLDEGLLQLQSDLYYFDGRGEGFGDGCRGPGK